MSTRRRVHAVTQQSSSGSTETADQSPWLLVPSSMMTLDPCLECHSVPANDVPVDHEQFEVSCQNPSPLRPIRQTNHAGGSKPRRPVLPRWSGRRVCPLDNRCDWLAYEAEVQYIHARGEYFVPSFCTCLSNCHGGPSATGARSVPHLSLPGEALSGSRIGRFDWRSWYPDRMSSRSMAH